MTYICTVGGGMFNTARSVIIQTWIHGRCVHCQFLGDKRLTEPQNYLCIYCCILC